MPRTSPTAKARRFVERRTECAARLNPAGRRAFLASSLMLVNAGKGKGSFCAADRAYISAQLTALLIKTQEAA